MSEPCRVFRLLRNNGVTSFDMFGVFDLIDHSYSIIGITDFAFTLAVNHQFLTACLILAGTDTIGQYRKRF